MDRRQWAVGVTDLRVSEKEQREFVDVVVDEVQNAPDEQLAGTVSATLALFTINTTVIESK